jgi:probable F420-dependent oxidoreductase
MHFGINLNNLRSDQLLDVAKAAEDLGFESVWLGEHIVMPRDLQTAHPSGSRPQAALDYLHHEPFSALSAIAAVTTELRVGTGVCLLPLRDPFNVARASATVDVLSGGRFLLGVGLGWAPEEYRILGIDWHTRGARLEEAVRLVRVLWTEESPAFEGRFYSCPPVGFRPKPTRPGGVPILPGAYSDTAIKRAARVGDGFFGSARNTNVAQAQLQVFCAELGAVGRTLEGLDLTNGARTPVEAEALMAAGYTRVSAGIVPPDDPVATLRDLASRFGSLLSR